MKTCETLQEIGIFQLSNFLSPSKERYLFPNRINSHFLFKDVLASVLNFFFCKIQNHYFISGQPRRKLNIWILQELENN